MCVTSEVKTVLSPEPSSVSSDATGVDTEVLLASEVKAVLSRESSSPAVVLFFSEDLSVSGCVVERLLGCRSSSTERLKHHLAIPIYQHKILSEIK